MVVGEVALEEFDVKIRQRRRSVLSPLLSIIAVLDLTSKKTIMKDAMSKLLYADDLVLAANGKQELQETLLVIRLCLEKTEVLLVSHQRLAQGDSFVYLGGVLCGYGNTERGRGYVEEQLRGDDEPADLQKTKGHEHLCDTGMPVQKGNLGNDRTTATKAASMRKQTSTSLSHLKQLSRERPLIRKTG